jgi:ribosomal protein L37E
MPKSIELYERKQLHVCPKCGRESLHQLSHTHFRCLWCGFDRNVDVDEWNVLQTLVAIAGAVLAIAAL